MSNEYLEFSEVQFIGERKNQEDYSSIKFLGPSSTELVGVLADGMGGHSSGEVASRIAVDCFYESFESFRIPFLPSRLGASLQAANAQIAKEISANPRLEGMGCTLVGIVVAEQALSWISVGDSPLYLFRNGALERLNEDHSMTPVLQKLVQAGNLSNDEFNIHPQRHSLRSALTGDRLPLIDASREPFPLEEGDIILCSSDGLMTLTEAEIVQILKVSKGLSAIDIGNRLIDAIKAKAQPRQDNVTIQTLVIAGTRKKIKG